MTAPAGTQNSEGPNGGVSFDEIEQQLRDAEKQALQPKWDDIKLDGDDLPETVRGKSVREALAHTKALEDALRISEQSRQQAMLIAQQAQQSGQPAPKPQEPEPEPQITAEQVAEAFNEDPAKGVELMQKMNQQAIAQAARHFTQRLEPMMQGTAAAAEAAAKQRYPDEFELYKDEIQDVLKQVPDKQVMSTPQSWDDLIAFVRGKNPLKLYEHLDRKKSTAAADSARNQQREDVGFQSVASTRAPAPTGSPVLDPVVDEVCRVMGMSKEEYIKWSKV